MIGSIYKFGDNTVAYVYGYSLDTCVFGYLQLSSGPRRKKTCLWRFANNKGADQPAHPRSLISDFVIHLLESIISKLAPAKFQYSS